MPTNFNLSLVLIGVLLSWLSPTMQDVGSAGPFRDGDPQRCPQVNHTSLDILPGSGWDNLRNIEMSPVLRLDFSHCRTTNDRRFLIPDIVVVTPVRQGQLDVSAETFTHWTSFTSLTSRSINLGAKTSYKPYGTISGSFSDEHQNTKRRQILDSSITTRVQVRQIEYYAQSLPDSPLDKTFRSRILEIAAHLQINDSLTSQYLLEKLVRDFGTHYVTGIQAGAVLVQEDHIRRSFVGDGAGTADHSHVAMAASGTFFKSLGLNLSVGYDHGTTEDNIRGYMDNRTSSRVFTLGGPPLLPEFSARAWTNGIKDNLVPVDRIGERLDDAINPSTLPEVPAATLNDIVSGLQQAIKQYYVHNSHIGCMDPTSEMFDKQANVGERICAGSKHNFTFGGVYQTCRRRDGEVCTEHTQINPKTRDFSCPDGYQAIELWKGVKTSCSKICYDWFLDLNYCYDDCSGVVNITSFWCAPAKAGKTKTGYLFGGLYSPRLLNPVTGLKQCPEYFYPLQMGFDISVCASDDFELGMPIALPFAGFYSCDAGNPLVFHNRSNSLTSTRFKHSLQGHLRLLGAKQWPKQCPTGYSQHLAGIPLGCEIMYCVLTSSLQRDITPPARRPPYISPPKQINNATLMVLTRARKVLYRSKDKHSLDWHETDISNAAKLFKKEPILRLDVQSSSQATGLSPGAAAGLSIGIALLVGTVIALVVFGHRRWKRLKDANRLLSPDVRRYCKDPENAITKSVES